MHRRRSFQFISLLSSLAMFCAATAIASQSQTLTTLHSFAGYPTEGSAAYAALVQVTEGSLYGTTSSGGDNGLGTVFKITPTGALTTLYSFCAQPDCADGAAPYGALVQAPDGNFYGTTDVGGSGAIPDGTVFKTTPSGTLTTLYSFCAQSGCSTDGANPYAGLVQATDGSFYGTTIFGGDHQAGTVFKITPNGALTKLYSFGSQSYDGSSPYAGLVQGTDGNFYGTTNTGGLNPPNGTVFKITPEGMLTTLHSFAGTDGANPYARLVQATDGNFYGTTYVGGNYSNCGGGCGTVFKITPNGTLTTLYNFCTQPGCTDGGNPFAGLVQGTDGNLYGTTVGGGANGGGTVFRIIPGGGLTTLYSFCSQSNCADGAEPYAGLVEASDGSLYGVTRQGGTYSHNCPDGCGTVFSLSGALSAYTLTVSTSGNGTVTSTDGFINCPGTCSHSYPTFTQVTLNATPGQGWVFGGWNGVCRGTGSCILTMTQPLTVDAIFSQALQFVAVTPCRLVDTRSKNGGGGPIQGGKSEDFNLPQLAQQGTNCPTLDLSSAAAYSLNVTVVPAGPLGYLTIWPTGENQPNVSTMNSLDGRVKANAAIVPAGTSGAVSVFVSNTSDVVLDIDGYFTLAGPSTLAFYPLPPCRVADTRHDNYPQGLGAPYLTGQQPRDLPVLESPCFQGVSSPAAYSFNFTVVPHVPLGYLTVWPAGLSQPNVSTLNAGTGTVVANAAIIPGGMGDGDIEVFASNDTDLVVDVNGYFALPTQGNSGLSLYPVAPCRVIDTRHGNGAFSGELTVNVVGSVCGPSSLTQAYVFNATVVPSGPLGYLTLWPDSQPQQPPPGVSTLNALDGAITSNMAIVPNGDGSTDAFASNLTQLILDISSYFAP